MRGVSNNFLNVRLTPVLTHCEGYSYFRLTPVFTHSAGNTGTIIRLTPVFTHSAGKTGTIIRLTLYSPTVQGTGMNFPERNEQ